jgi:hypothetical protein
MGQYPNSTGHTIMDATLVISSVRLSSLEFANIAGLEQCDRLCFDLGVLEVTSS